MTLSLSLLDEQATVSLGSALAKVVTAPCYIYFYGELGAGKTSLIRAILRGFGIKGAVKSPTFTIVEPYELNDGSIFHFDLYRIADAQELEYLGWRDYFTSRSICLVEWPERVACLPEPDLQIYLEFVDVNGRVVKIVANSERGARIISFLNRFSEQA